MKDIWDLRMAKLRKSTDLMVSEQESHAVVRSQCQWMHSRGFPYHFTYLPNKDMGKKT